jgi:hypothetical protein
MERSPETERLIAARKAAAADLRLPETDWRVRRFAVLSIAYEGHEALLASGRDVEADTLLKLDEAMQAIRASIPPERITVQLTRSHGPFTVCPECGFKPPDNIEIINREGETIIEGFRRLRAERGAESEAVIAIQDRGATSPHEKSEGEQATVSVASKPMPESKPYHETAVKDSRPGAQSNGGGSVVWSTPINRERQF